MGQKLNIPHDVYQQALVIAEREGVSVQQVFVKFIKLGFIVDAVQAQNGEVLIHNPDSDTLIKISKLVSPDISGDDE